MHLHLIENYIMYLFYVYFKLFFFSLRSRLPLPWLLFGIINGEPVRVNSKGMVCSIVLLFAMLIFVIISIACFRWKMNKGLGFTMFLLYFVFVAVSLGLEYGYLHCPSEQTFIFRFEILRNRKKIEQNESALSKILLLNGI